MKAIHKLQASRRRRLAQAEAERRRAAAAEAERIRLEEEEAERQRLEALRIENERVAATHIQACARRRAAVCERHELHQEKLRREEEARLERRRLASTLIQSVSRRSLAITCCKLLIEERSAAPALVATATAVSLAASEAGKAAALERATTPSLSFTADCSPRPPTQRTGKAADLKSVEALGDAMDAAANCLSIEEEVRRIASRNC